MGSIAGQNIILLMLTAMEHDMQFRLSRKMDASQALSMRSIFLGNKKAQLYQMFTLSDKDPRYKQAQHELKKIEAMERKLQVLEKQMEMEMKQFENQLKIIQQRKDTVQKMLDKNIQQGFGGGGR